MESWSAGIGNNVCFYRFNVPFNKRPCEGNNLVMMMNMIHI